MEKSDMEKNAPAEGQDKKKGGKNKNRGTHVKAKLLDTFYGHPMKDMKLIVVTGTAGKVEVAHFVHEILQAAGQPVAIMATENGFRLGTLHKFLSKSWKAGSNYVVVTAPAEALNADIFYGLPVHIAALTNYLDASMASSPAEDYAAAGKTLFQMDPGFVILNRDDKNYEKFSDFAGTKGTLTYGSDRFSNIQIVSSQLYKKGVEATLAIGTTRFTVASFLTGEPIVSYMAAAAAIADALHVTTEKISEGIANYQPEA